MLNLLFGKKEPRHVEIVVVHGMGRQKAGETLLEWSEALLKRIDWYAKEKRDPSTTARARAIVPLSPQSADTQTEPSSVEFDHVALTTGEDEVVARVTYIGADDEAVDLSLRFTEARWSDSFPALSKSQIFGWGLGFVWRTGTRVARYLTNLFFASGKGFAIRALGYAIAAVATAIAWVLTMVAAGILSVFLVLVGPLLLIPFTAKLLSPIVDILVDFVGDVPVWSRHPVRAAAMAGIVTEKLTAARAHARRKGDEVMVIAHSEGAAITTNVLFAEPGVSAKIKVDTLVTVGAAVTLIGRTGWTDRQVKGDGKQADGRPLDPVSSWSRTGELRARWINFWASWDIIPSGPISTGFGARRRRWAQVYLSGESRVTSDELGPEEHLVHNTGSMLGDHQSYASNVIQVVDPIARALLGLDGPPSPGAATAPPAGADGRQLHKRNASHVFAVKALGLHRALIVTLVLVALLLPVARHRLELTFPWLEQLRDKAATALGVDPEDGFFAWLFGLEWLPLAIVLGALAALLLWFNSFLWRAIERSIVAKTLGQDSSTWTSILFVVFRIVLVVLIWLVVSVLGQDAWLNEPIGIVSVLVGMFVVFFPLLGHVPRVVEQNYGKGYR